MPSSFLDQAEESEYRAARLAAAYYQYPVPTVVRVEGRDRVEWLHKLVTADVHDMKAGEGRRSALLDAKGHFVAVFNVLVRSDDILLVADGALLSSLLDSLRHYIFREKVQLTDASDGFAAYAVIGPGARTALEKSLHVDIPTAPLAFIPASFENLPALVIQSDALSVPSVDVLLDPARSEAFVSALDMPRLSDHTYEILRVEAGTPRWGMDLDPSVLALEAPQGLNIRVDQGCYVGQEVVARIVHRGHVNKKLVGLVLAHPAEQPAGVPIRLLDGQEEIGQITSLVYSPTFNWIALGMLRSTQAEENQEVETEGEPRSRARVVGLPFSRVE